MQNLSCENEFNLHENKKSFSHQSLRTYPGFESEAWGTPGKMASLSLQKRGGDWAKLTKSKRLLGLLLRTEVKIGQLADRHVHSNNPRNTCGAHFSSSSLLVSKLANSEHEKKGGAKCEEIRQCYQHR